MSIHHIETHAICDDCWNENHPTRAPYRMVAAEREYERCGLCNIITISGIYWRGHLMDFADDEMW